MPKGTVKLFNTTKGYGFTAPATGGKDIFVHVSAVEQSGLTGLADAIAIEFDLTQGRDGREMAGNLRKAQDFSKRASGGKTGDPFCLTRFK